MSHAAQLGRAVAAGALRPLDLHFARWLGDLSRTPTPGCLLAAALASLRVGQGHVCLELAAVAGRGSPLPVFAIGGPTLPGWVGPLDIVVVLGGGDRTSLAAAHEAVRRGCQLLVVTPAGTDIQGAMKARVRR